MKRLAIVLLSFVVGALLSGAPCVISGYLAHAEEAARGEETMGPGWTTFLGLVAAPFGGAVAAAVAFWWTRRRGEHEASQD